MSLDFAVGFHHNRATTRWIDAMPALPGFHDHGPFSSLSKNGWASAKAIAGWAGDHQGAKISISKLKSKRHFNAKPTYRLSTNGSSTGGLRGAESTGVRCIFALLALIPLRIRATSMPQKQCRGKGCEGGERLLKFVVCWDAAVCAVSAGGFFSVWEGVRKADRRRPVLSA